MKANKTRILAFLFLLTTLGVSCRLPSLAESPLELLAAMRVSSLKPCTANCNSTATDETTNTSSAEVTSTNQINYSNSPFNLVTGASSLNETPVLTGTFAYFTVSPNLPFGLRLERSTGIISGKISEVVSNADYTIKAYTASEVSVSVTIRISSSIPTACADVTITTGTGTAVDPFIICNPNQLQSLSVHHISNPGVYYQLNQDLDLSSIANFTPISNITNQFTGTFDGQNHTIHNLTINNNATSHQGLFGYVVGGSASEIRNLRLNRANVRGNAQSGSVIGYLDATARNIHSNNAIIDGFADGTGGLIGRLSGTGVVNDSSFSGQVTGNGSYTGGIVGDSFGGDLVLRCKANGTISGVNIVGGILGRAAGTPAENSYWQGTVTGSAEVGGLIGKGQLSGGVAKNSYSVGAVTGTSATGGAMGSVTGTVVASYYNVDVATQVDNDTRGTPKTTLQMKCPVQPDDPCATSPIYSSWDTSVWDFGTKNEYPKLKWENSF